MDALDRRPTPATTHPRELLLRVRALEAALADARAACRHHQAVADAAVRRAEFLAERQQAAFRLAAWGAARRADAS
jgi:hypothetical protein